MKKWIILFLCLFIGVLLFQGGKLMNKKNEVAVQQIVKEKYMNDEGLIHAYPYQRDSQYLSESIGLYMSFLLRVKDKEEFEDQYQKLVAYFLIQENEKAFIRWELREDVSVNALIDDVRIIDALIKGSETFHEDKYRDTAKVLQSTIHDNQMRDGLYTDFYDWNLKMPSSRLTYSYITPELLQLLPDTEKNRESIEKIESASIFFPEYNNIEANQYVNANEAHMVDQLLIAQSKEYIGQETDFKKWIVAEWQEKKVINGRYNKGNLKPTVPYESLAVYYYLYTYFMGINQPKLAKEVKVEANKVADDHDSDQEHFFDFIHFQLLQLSD